MHHSQSAGGFGFLFRNCVLLHMSHARILSIIIADRARHGAYGRRLLTNGFIDWPRVVIQDLLGHKVYLDDTLLTHQRLKDERECPGVSSPS